MKARERQTYVQPWAKLAWQTPLTPRSEEHDDIYWSPGHALGEKQHVFIEGNRLSDRWARLDGAHFTLAETGFGFGINCLVSANLWRRRCGGGILHYVAFEKSPVHPNDLTRLHAALAPQPGFDWPCWQAHARQLIASYPLPSPGDHLIWLDTDICLRLVVGDVNDTLYGLDGRVDAWYLDGFSPAGNPDAWSHALFARMARASRPGATYATYSVAGHVRRGLATAGFSVHREPGYGNKAEMLCGSVNGTWRPAALNRPRVGIIGAGLAGLYCAQALARRGVETSVFDRHAAPLAGASCVPRLAVSPRLAARPDRGSLLSLAAFQYAMQQESAVASGYCRFAARARDPSRHERIAGYFDDDFCTLLAPAEAARRTGVHTRFPALWFEGAGWCEPARQFVSPAAGCSLITGTSVMRLQADHGGVRTALANGEQHEFDVIVIAAGASHFNETTALSLRKVRGQSIVATLGAGSPDCVVAGTLSLVPGRDGHVIAGATFDLDDDDETVRDSDTALIAEQLHRMTGTGITVAAAYAGVRCTTRDRNPVAGPLPDAAALAEYTRSSRRYAFTDYAPGLYACTGFGSHGATHAPLCAEHIARLITGEPDCINEGWASLLDAARFAMKKLV